MFLTSNTTSVKLPSISICLTRTREEDSGLIITNVIKYTKNYNCSAEIGEITQSLICASGQFDGLNGNYPEWNNKPKLVDYLDGFFKKLYRNINFQNDWALSMKKKLLLKNYDIHTAIKTVLSIDFKKIEHLSISKLVYENYVNCSIHLEKQDMNSYLYLLFTGDCLNESSKKLLFFSYLREEMEKINLWSWKSDPYLLDDNRIHKQFEDLQFLMETSLFEQFRRGIQELQPKVVSVLKTNLIGSAYLTTNLLLRYYYQTWWKRKRYLNQAYDLRESYLQEDGSNILHCNFNDRKCREEELSRILTKEGLCYQITRKDHATSLTIDINTYLYFSTFSTERETKLILTIQENGKRPTIVDSKMDILNGRSISLAIISKPQLLLNSNNWGNCSEPTSEFKHKYNIKGKYSRGQCIQECYYRLVVERCGCKIYHDPVHRYGINHCTNITTNYCAFITTENFEWKKYCQYCTQECNFQIFEKIIISSTPCPLKFREKYASCDDSKIKSSIIDGINNDPTSSNYNRRCLNPLNFNRSLTKLKMFFDGNVIENHKQKKSIILSTTLSQIGGSLGICIGGSILTLFELIYILMAELFRIIIFPKQS